LLRCNVLARPLGTPASLSTPSALQMFALLPFLLSSGLWLPSSFLPPSIFFFRFPGAVHFSPVALDDLKCVSPAQIVNKCRPFFTLEIRQTGPFLPFPPPPAAFLPPPFLHCSAGILRYSAHGALPAWGFQSPFVIFPFGFLLSSLFEYYFFLILPFQGFFPFMCQTLARDSCVKGFGEALPSRPTPMSLVLLGV